MLAQKAHDNANTRMACLKVDKIKNVTTLRVCYRPINDLRYQLNNCQTLVADGHYTLDNVLYSTPMKNRQRLQNDIDNLRKQIRRTAFIPLAALMFTVGLGLSSAEAYISHTMTYIIGLGALLISVNLYKIIIDKHPVNAQVRVMTKELLNWRFQLIDATLYS